MAIKPKTLKPTETKATIQAGTVEIDGQTYEVVGNATLPTLKVEEEKAVVVKFLGEIVTREKLAKDGNRAIDEDGKPASISVVEVASIPSGEVAQLVVGAVLARALSEYKVGYVGKTFRLVKHAARNGSRAKAWTVQEVAKKA